MPTQPPAATIGKYQILGLVGEGAMGAVYRALDPVLQRPVAIKVMSDSVAREQELRERFLREAQAAGSLQHPNVVTIYDFGEVDGHLFIAMEFLDGEDLEVLLARQTALALPTKLGIAIDVLGGLSYAHKRGIVHRDIKPANIRVTEDARAKIMDFGVAHLTSQKMTRTGMTMGTPNYMAPEQVSAGPIGAHTDVFSLGAVLYELLTNVKPFAAETLHAVLFRIVSDPTAPPSAVAPGIPPELDAIVLKALEKDPTRRYQTATEMANDLTVARARLDASASVSLNARLATAVPGMPQSPPTAPPAASAPVAAPAGAGRGALMVTGALAVVALGVGAWALTRDRSGTAPDAPPPIVADASTGGEPTAPPAPAGSATTDAIPPAEPASERLPERVAARDRTAPDPGARATTTTATTATTAPPPPVRPTPPPFAVTSTSRPAAPEAALPVPAVTAGAPSPAAPPPAASPAAAPAAGADATEEIGAVVARYARAITARDLGAVRAAYPGITAGQEANFQRFFGSVRELRASFAVSGVDVTGQTAEARLDGAYEFVTSGGQRERSPVRFQASFRREGGGWVLTTVR